MIDVVGYEELFSITSDGRLFSKRTNKFLKPSPNHNGYLTIATKIGGRSGKNVCFRLHRLVAEAYIPNSDPTKTQVNHIDGNKTNNDVSNLEWVTPAENMKHASSTGLLNPRRGPKVLTDSNIAYIRSVYVKGSRTFGARALGREFGVSHTTILAHMAE